MTFARTGSFARGLDGRFREYRRFPSPTDRFMRFCGIVACTVVAVLTIVGGLADGTFLRAPNEAAEAALIIVG